MKPLPTSPKGRGTNCEKVKKETPPDSMVFAPPSLPPFPGDRNPEGEGN